MPTVPEENIITRDQIDEDHVQKITDQTNAHGIPVNKEDVTPTNDETSFPKTPELVKTGAEFMGSLAEDLTRPVLGGSLVRTAGSENFLERLKAKLRRINPGSELKEAA